MQLLAVEQRGQGVGAEGQGAERHAGQLHDAGHGLQRLDHVGAHGLGRQRLQVRGAALQIGALFNCSVSRDFFEPATACLVHHNLGIPEESLVLDITNACIGFSDGMIMLSHLIEAGTVKAGIICAGENVSKVVHTTCDQLLGDPQVTREKILQMLPTLTLGCGAVAAVLCHDSILNGGHKFVGGVARSASQHHQLC
ncbi:MAG: hypothetical protein EBY81_06385, partial [Verrucomicrobia bacterium]|nr:hypothetical protein [Verrucomicrobiota bacterium]